MSITRALAIAAAAIAALIWVWSMFIRMNHAFGYTPHEEDAIAAAAIGILLELLRRSDRP